MTGLIWHVKDLNRRELALDLNDITIGDLQDGHQAYEVYVQNRDKGGNIKSIKRWSEKIECEEWDRKVTETFSLIYRRHYCPITYVIRPDKTLGWDPLVNAMYNFERLMYQLPLNGIAYKHDNKTMFLTIKIAVGNTPAETWIYDYVPGRDGCGAMRALHDHFEGEAELDVRATKVPQTLDTLVYMNKRIIPFERVITTLNKAYSSLK